MTIGNRGTVLQSGRFITELELPRYEPAVGALVGVNGVLGQRYRLEISDNLQQWPEAIRFTNNTERTVITDTNALTRSQRFYRLVTE